MTSTHSYASWGPAIALGVLVGSAAVLPHSSTVARDLQQFVLDFELAASKPTTAEILVDRGAGFDASFALALAISMSADPQPYSVPLSPGRYRGFRFDPFPDNGEFVLQNARIRDRYGNVAEALDLSRLESSPDIVIKEATSSRVAGVAPAGGKDPFLQYRFDSPVILWISRRDLARLLLIGLLVAVLVAAGAYPLLRVDRPIGVAPEASVLPRPRRLIVLTAAVASVLATYPLLVGHSLMTPNNGPLAFHYATPPYVAGSNDGQIESARAADVQATMWVTLPYAVAQRAAIADGEFPWWNRYSENGVPLVGQGQTAFFDPLQWLLMFGDLALGADLKFIAARAVFVVGAALAALAVTESVPAALLVALAAPFLGHFIARFNDAIHFSIVYAPWILVAYGALLRADTMRRAALAATGLLIATALVMFSSSPKEAFALLPSLHLAGLMAIAMQAWRAASSRPQGLRAMALAVAAIAGSALLTAPHWLVFLETLSHAGTAYDRTMFSYADSSQGLALAAGVFRPGMVFGGLNPVLAVLMLFGVLRARMWIDHPLAVGCVVVAGCLLAVAFGGVPESVLMRVPLVPQIHHIGSTLLTAVLPFLVMVAAMGAASLSGAGVLSGRVGVVIAVMTGLLLTSGMVLTADLSDPTFGFGLTACVWTGVFCYLAMRVAERRGRITTGIAGLAMAGLLLPAGLHLSTGLRPLDALLVQPRERAPLTAIPDALAPVVQSTAGPARVAGVNGVFQGGIPSYGRFEGITGADSLFSPETLLLGKHFDLNYPLSLRAHNPHVNPLTPLLDLWGVRWLVVPTPPSAPTRLDVIERRSAWPRAFFVDRAEQHADRRAFTQRLRTDSRPFASVHAGDEQAGIVTRDLRGLAAVFAQASDYRLTANTTRFAITAPTAGVIVLNETFWPGVTAMVGEQHTPVFRVNETMRAIAVPQGTWQVTFAYRPAMWNLATALAAGGVTVLLALLLGSRLASPSSPPPS